MVLLTSHPQQRVNFVNENNTGLDFLGKCKNCSCNFLALSIPLVSQAGYVQVNESCSGLPGSSLSTHCLATPRGSVKQYTPWSRQKFRTRKQLFFLNLSILSPQLNSTAFIN